MSYKYIFLLSAFTLGVPPGIYCQERNEVVVDYNTRRFLSGVSELDRSKYFNIHSTSDDDKDVGKFLATIRSVLEEVLGTILVCV